MRTGGHAWDYGTWADDLERAIMFQSRQNFPATTAQINRWLTRSPQPEFS